MIKAIIFDCDGMVVESERVSKRYSSEFNVPMSSFDRFFGEEFQKCVVGQADLKIELEKYFSEWRWTKSVDEFLAYWFDPTFNRVIKQFESPVSDFRKMGIKTYMATNNEKYRTDDLMKNKGLGKWFDGVFASGYMGCKKPEVLFFGQMVKDIGFPLEDILFWDDDQKNIEGAKKFSLPAERYISLEQFTARMKEYIDA